MQHQQDRPAPTGMSHAAAWGLGSLLLGLLLPLGVPLGSIAVASGFTAYAAHGGRLDLGDIRDLFGVILLSLAVIAVVPVLGLVFAVRGLIWAGREKAP